MRNAFLLCSALFLTAGLSADEAAKALSDAAAKAALDGAPAAVTATAWGWKQRAQGTVNLSQAYLDNWVAGGDDLLAWQLSFLGSSTLDLEHHNWSNTLKLAYGQSKVGDAEPRKSADSIRFDSVYVPRLFKALNPYASASFETQFYNGYSYASGTPTAVSKFMDPGYITESLGVGAGTKQAFKTRVGAAAKQTITDAYPKPYADDPNTPAVEKVKSEFGVVWVTDLHLGLADNVTYDSKLDVFSNLKAADQIDVAWSQVLTAKVNAWFNTTLAVDFDYDRDASTQRQLKETLAIGISHDFL